MLTSNWFITKSPKTTKSARKNSNGREVTKITHNVGVLPLLTHFTILVSQKTSQNWDMLL